MNVRPAGRVGAALRGLGPATGGLSVREALRAGAGAGVALGLVGLVLAASEVDLRTGLFLIAPFGATAVLVFAAPNSPLAQPWPAVVGNTVSAAVGVAATLVVPLPALRVALAVGLSVALMIGCHAVHPPAGAVAMTAALSPETIQSLGFRFVLAPVLAGTLLLVVLAAGYARLTGRRYPYRRFDAAPPPAARLGLDEDELTGILDRYEQSLNLGVADLARLIGAAELQAAGHRAGPLAATDVMSRDLVTVGPETSLRDVAALFDEYGFTSLPVISGEGTFVGVVFQIHLVRRLMRPDGVELRAADVMSPEPAVAFPGTPVGALLPLLAESGCDAVPVLEGQTLVGIVTRTDLIAALARQTLRDPLPPGAVPPSAVSPGAVPQ
ncbi:MULTISPECIES: HPP family protein [Gordonia]|uniref:HPP family protein n=1 Tax=Gordonia TaxID=2053 RepID=UPI001EF5A269|nr:HPP family protein [Gordonia sp. McavH-238-E]MCG7631468.1 HPP family protein [Gordonia sp. McavH-238-E]